MSVQFQNFYEATLSAPCADTDLSISLTPIPSVSEGWLLIDYDNPAKREFIYFTSKGATSVNGPDLATFRGRDGTTAVPHDQNAKVRMNVNKGILEGLRDGTAITGIFPAGIIMSFSGAASPTGFLLCDGAAVSRGTYSTLFSVISTTYGAGDGSTTFNVPNLKGKSVIGYNASETEFNALGKTGGEKTHILTTGEMPSHNHAISDPGHSHGLPGDPIFTSAGGNSRAYNGGSGQQFQWSIGGVQPAGTGISVQSAGSSGAHNNLAPYMSLNYIIKT